MDPNIDEEDISPAARPPKMFNESEIYQGENIDFLLNQLKESTGSDNISYELIYRATRDKDAEFHSFCDDRGPNISLIMSNFGQVFGGYCKNSWSGNGNFSNDSTSFLFSLTNSKIYKIKKPIYATYNVKVTYIMSYGYPDGILLFDNFLSGQNNKAYIQGNCYHYNEGESGIVNIGGADTFKVEECEVFKVIFKTQDDI